MSNNEILQQRAGAMALLCARYGEQPEVLMAGIEEENIDRYALVEHPIGENAYIATFQTAEDAYDARKAGMVHLGVFDLDSDDVLESGTESPPPRPDPLEAELADLANRMQSVASRLRGYGDEDDEVTARNGDAVVVPLLFQGSAVLDLYRRARWQR